MKRYRFLFYIISSIIIAGCASIGSPDGGRYDEEPPQVVYANPADKATNTRQKKIKILFDEFIKLDNPNDKVTVSPPQKQVPNIQADGKSIKITLFDTLKSNTTYTIDFSDAIQDNNEGNPMGLYTYSFSTGETIDTMEVSGTVLNASNLEPIKGIMVGLYRQDKDSVWADSIFRTRSLERVARTNGSGKFSIKGVANGSYRAFALGDMDANFSYTQKSEQIAFDTTIYTTSNRPDLRPDTVWRDTSRYEKIKMTPYIHYLPDDIVLLAFLEDGQDRHLLKTERKTPEKFTLYFTAPSDSLPIINGHNFDAAKHLFVEASAKRDTITYWIPDTTVAYQDTLKFDLTYLDTDSLGQLVLHTDSCLELVAKQTHAKIERERQKKIDEWNAKRAKMEKKAKKPLAHENNPFETTYMELQVKPGGTIDPNQNLRMTFSEPIAAIDTSRIEFVQKVDSEYVSMPYLLLPDSISPSLYTLYAEWEPKATYELRADSLTFTSILGHNAQTFRSTIRVRATEEFGSLYLNLNNMRLKDGEVAYVELLGKNDSPQRREEVRDGKVDFYYLKPADYYLRLFIDRNGDGKWTTGNYDQQLQPEEVFYFPRPITIRANWEMEQAWDVRGIARDKQKPAAITKQKPDKQKTIKNRNAERAGNR